ncbi:aldehyde dehydrogenase family protein [Kitasatospora viridis]|uniref:Aldehyde dehydrogenase family protein n=1 Tax=Kitasatospora viridis TaxID=281105 RepID=A0A561UHV3_9ACTN|nr:aldehyde dehydrogenase family protein [Kitasatospora viridis]TWF98942.1 aldehyde dehydrogenase family protein [Kitasatospora viridis]
MNPTAPAPGAAPLPLLRRGEWTVSQDSAPTAAGLPAVSLAPEVLVRSDARRLRGRTAALPDREGRAAIVRAAWRRFTGGTVRCGGLGPQGPEEFAATLWAGAGLPAALVERWQGMLTDRLDAIVTEPEAPRTAAGRPPLTLVSLPGNTFTCLESVLRAAAAGSALWVRPSTREPFSALRLVAALVEEGWPAELIGCYPTARPVLRALVEVTDRQVLYGGAEVAAEFGDRATATVHGPLRVRAVVAAGAEPASAARQLLELVAGDAGRFCTTVRSILCLDDPEPVAVRLGELLDGIRLAPADPAWPLAASRDAEGAARTAEHVERRIGPADRRFTRRPLLSTAADGSRYLAPTLVGVEPRSGTHPLLGFEPPFPFATVLRATPEQAAALAADGGVTHHIVNHPIGSQR